MFLLRLRAYLNKIIYDYFRLLGRDRTCGVKFRKFAFYPLNYEENTHTRVQLDAHLYLKIRHL